MYSKRITFPLKVDQFFRQGDSSFFYAFLYLSCVVQLVALLCLVVILWKFEESKRKSSTVVYYTLRLVSYYTLLLITIAPIPIFNTFLEALICTTDDSLKSDSNCYEGYNLVNTIFAAMALAVFVPLCLIAQFLHIDENPASDIPFAGPQSNLGMFKLAIKIALAIYTTLDGDVICFIYFPNPDSLILKRRLSSSIQLFGSWSWLGDIIPKGISIQQCQSMQLAEKLSCSGPH